MAWIGIFLVLSASAFSWLMLYPRQEPKVTISLLAYTNPQPWRVNALVTISNGSDWVLLGRGGVCIEYASETNHLRVVSDSSDRWELEAGKSFTVPVTVMRELGTWRAVVFFPRSRFRAAMTDSLRRSFPLDMLPDGLRTVPSFRVQSDWISPSNAPSTLPPPE
jgi:hypothetical protein